MRSTAGSREGTAKIMGSETNKQKIMCMANKGEKMISCSLINNFRTWGPLIKYLGAMVIMKY